MLAELSRYKVILLFILVCFQQLLTLYNVLDEQL